MTKISEILILDLHEDIKSVIDLQDYSENAIQQEIEAYIVTEGIGRHLDTFLNRYTSNLKETGVWLSGFYGSGKSYFGKMLGYILADPMINGTGARDRFIPRLKGVSDENLLENSIRNLDAIRSRVILLDAAKQNTDRGFAFTLFVNLLKQMGLRDDVYGYMEWDLLIESKHDEFIEIVERLEKEPWSEVKLSNRRVAKVMRNAFVEMQYSPAEYEDTLKVYHEAVNNFSASKLKEELEKYLKQNPDETLVFIFDEASEAISQKKFSLLDLEGISEALSSISTRVWTIAIAQEKLDDVINNANVNRSMLTKVTDRYKTKIHIESTEVDVIIRNRLLKKNKTALKQLEEYYKKNEGQIADATNLKSLFPTQTKNAEDFATYYPFHKYQFDILQKFLFSSNALVATQIAARGMIITTFDVLRKQMKAESLFAFTPGHAICSEAQTAPPVALGNKYDTAKQIIKESKILLDGELLLKTIHLLSDSEVVSASVENITKSYISDVTSYYQVKPEIEKALLLLVDAKVLLLSNNNYKITSDLEGKMLEEMKDYEVELFTKKRALTNYLKEYKLFNAVASYTDGSDSFKFSILSDQDDDLTSAGSKDLKVVVYSLFNIGEVRQDFIQQIKMDTQYKKDETILIPDNSDFSYIDKLITEVTRYQYMEDKYANESDDTKRVIIREFRMMREERSKELRVQIEAAYHNATLVYMFDEHLLNDGTFKSVIGDIQKKIIKNIYTKRLPVQLSESLVPKIFKVEEGSLKTLFSGADFAFFDGHGNFVGDHLKVVDELQTKIKSRFIDGKSLESDLSAAPWAYTYGTIVTTLAVLLRAGRLTVKYNAQSWYSYKETGVHEAFTNGTKFKSASFKSITATLSSTQKSAAVQLLLDLEVTEHTGRKIDWNTSDYELAYTAGILADHFLSALGTLNSSINNFDSTFAVVVDQKQILQGFSGLVTDGNFIEKVEYLLSHKDEFRSAIQTIIKAQKFIKRNYSKVQEYKRFAAEVMSELKKSRCSDPNISQANDAFTRLFRSDLVKHYSEIGQQIQIIKDGYYKLTKTAAEGMTNSHQILKGKVDAAIKDLKKGYPVETNRTALKQLEDLLQDCQDRIMEDPQIELSVTCLKSGYTLSDMLNYTALVPARETELLILRNSFKKEKIEPNHPVEAKPGKPRVVKLSIPKRITTVKDYRAILVSQLEALANSQPEEEIELDIETP